MSYHSFQISNLHLEITSTWSPCQLCVWGLHTDIPAELLIWQLHRGRDCLCQHQHRDFHIVRVQRASERGAQWPRNTQEMAPWSSLISGSLSSDIDECSQAYSPCGQLCHNVPGSYSCTCVQGHQLYNGTSCRVTGEIHDPKQSLALALSLVVITDRSVVHGSL